MSEHQPSHEKQEHFKAPEQQAEHHRPKPEHQPKAEAQELAPVAELERSAKEEALLAKEVAPTEKATKAEPTYVNRELKELTFARTMTRVRKRLSKPDKALSKVVHQPVVASVSRVGEKTIARPSGLLTGSICAFLGSSFFLWMSRHYGFEYNYLLFFLFFVGGFAVGLVLELVFWLFKRRQIS